MKLKLIFSFDSLLLTFYTQRKFNETIFHLQNGSIVFVYKNVTDGLGDRSVVSIVSAFPWLIAGNQGTVAFHGSYTHTT